MVFSLAEGVRPDGVEAELAAIGACAEVREDHTVAVSFNPHRLQASELTRRIVNGYPVADLAVEAADLERIIAEIYEQGATYA